jgi:class 3 adenylate cyclase
VVARDERPIPTNDGLSDMTHADPAQIERKLAAIMLADIAGFSALMERDETRTYQCLRALRDQIVAPTVAEYGGRVVKTTGDGFLAVFPSATASLGCGITIQRANISQEAMKDEQERFHLRIGINLGDVVIDGDDVSGDGVNIAARLEPLAPSDGICVSGAIRDQVREDLGVELEDIGDQHVKNISRPVRAYRIDIASASRAAPPAQPATVASWGRLLADRRMLPIAAVILALAGLLSFGPLWRSLPFRSPALRTGDAASGLAAGPGAPIAPSQELERSGRARVANDETIRSAAAANGVELPKVLEFHQPPAEVPDKFASYLGAWSSGLERWNGIGRRIILLIESISGNGEVLGHLGYSGPNQFTAKQSPASYKSFLGKISDEGLYFSIGPISRFEMVGADDMYGEQDGFGTHGLYHSTIRLTRLK